VEKPEDIRTIFDNHVYFGSEADDRMTAANVVRMPTGMNPDFFKGTVVEEDVQALQAEHGQ
jgi:hypothetical protein